MMAEGLLSVLQATAGVTGGGVFASVAGTGVTVAAGAADKRAIKSPSLILSPTFTKISCTTPVTDAGISIVALSDSKEIKDCSMAMVSPTLIKISMTSTA